MKSPPDGDGVKALCFFPRRNIAMEYRERRESLGLSDLLLV
ncbi:hypothetical protein [Citrobacter braakii]|nr:hypothetical protein [Citrobacter braakii]